MASVENTVFISYRRETSSFIARAIFMDLRQHGYDVFMDVENINSGRFESIILRQIAARAHFLLILTTGTLERCADPADWLRREIEEALRLKRNIIPMLVDDFRFKGIEMAETLQDLPAYNALLLPHEYFECAMERLRTRYLREPVNIEIKHIPAKDHSIIEEVIAKAETQPKPDENILLAEKYFNQANIEYDNGNYIDAVFYYSEAIKHNPQYVDAYINKGSAHFQLKHYAAAIESYDAAAALCPDDSDIYYRRGFIRHSLKEYQQALEDYTTTIRLRPNHSHALANRGILYSSLKEFEKAIRDYTAALKIHPGESDTYYNRAAAYQNLGMYREAIADYEECIRLNPEDEQAQNNRAALLSKVGK